MMPGTKKKHNNRLPPQARHPPPGLNPEGDERKVLSDSTAYRIRLPAKVRLSGEPTVARLADSVVYRIDTSASVSNQWSLGQPSVATYNRPDACIFPVVILSGWLTGCFPNSPVHLSESSINTAVWSQQVLCSGEEPDAVIPQSRSQAVPSNPSQHSS